MINSQYQNLSPKDRYVQFVLEREKVRFKKESGHEKPWTDNETLQKFKFCNVRRMDDRVSRWLLDNWYLPYFDHPNMLVACTLARQLNNTSSLDAVGFPTEWDPKRAEKILNERAKKKQKNFSGAYMITGTLGGTKIEQIVWKVVDPVHKLKPVINTRSMYETWKTLLLFAGFSTFIAGQVVADMRWAVEGEWVDRHVWAPIGPGSRRGLNRFNGRHYASNMTLKDFNVEFSKLLDFCTEAFPKKMMSRLEAMDIQNTLCEFDKFERTLWKEGKPKQRYEGV